MSPDTPLCYVGTRVLDQIAWPPQCFNQKNQVQTVQLEHNQSEGKGPRSSLGTGPPVAARYL